MKEHTDKPPQKTGRTPPRKRAARKPSPESKRATAPQDASRAPSSLDDAPAAAPPSRLAPDPETVVFGSNRPIVAPPPKLPEGSGLRFAGPSAGLLKATGPQPSSPKASGLTFMASKPAPAKAPGKSAAKKAEARKLDTQKPEGAKPEAPALTKPAIAPQASGRHFDRDRSTSGFVMMMLALTVLGGGLAFWMKLPIESTAPQQAALETPANDPVIGQPRIGQPGIEQAGPEQSGPQQPDIEQAGIEQPDIEPPALEQANLDTPTPGEPLAEQAGPGPEFPVPAGAKASLSSAEIGEIQDLLSRLDLDPGSTHGELTAATATAIRSYQEMAGLPADGEANRALLEELRSVAALYGS